MGRTEGPGEGGDARRSAFIDATLECLADYGHHGTTVRRIAARAGVAPGLLTHYFPGKDALVAAAYRTLAERLLEHFDRQMAKAGPGAAEQLRGFVAACFRGPNLDPKLLRIWINFWSLVATEPEASAVHAETYAAYRARIGRLLADASSEAGRRLDESEAAAMAIGILALLDGLWLEWCLDTTTFGPEEGRRIALEMIGARLGIDLAD